MPFEAKLCALPIPGETPNGKVNSFMDFTLDTLRKRIKPAVSEEVWDGLMSDLDFGRSSYLEGTAYYPIGLVPR